MKTITLPLADVAALVRLAWELTRHIEETDRSATGSIYGIEYADRTIAKVAALLPCSTTITDADRSAFFNYGEWLRRNDPIAFNAPITTARQPKT